MNEGARVRTTYALSVHAAYGCRERGACCTAGWPIPVERDALRVIEAALDHGRLFAPSTTGRLIDLPSHAPAGTPGLLGQDNGRCVFYRTSGVSRCSIHRALGHAALPLACQQFPRVSVIDARGTSVTLSHYCPTARELLDGDGAIWIDDRPTGLTSSADDAGLDVRAALPPLLAPGMLMDWESWWLWERESVKLIDEAASAGAALAALGSAVEGACTWRPADGPLDRRVVAAFRAARTGARAMADIPSPTDLAEAVWASIPDDLRPVRTGAKSAVVGPDVRRRFLAAHAFANWTAHLGHGLRTWLLSVRAADALLDCGFTPGEADLWLRHLVDPKVLAERLDAEVARD